MAIVIPSPNTTLAVLDSLSPPTGPPSSPPDHVATPPLTSPASLANDLATGRDTLSLSGGAAAALLNGLSGGLADAASAADAAFSAGSAVMGLLGLARSAAQAAADPTLAPDQRAALDQGFQADLAQIAQAVGSAAGGGLNLIDGSAVGPQALEGGATLTGTDLSVTGPVIGLAPGAGLSDAATAAAIADQLGHSMEGAGQALARIESQGQAIEDHLALVSQAATSLAPGVAGAVNVGLDGDGARLQALQVQQQLAGVGSGLANQAPQAILALFQ